MSSNSETNNNILINNNIFGTSTNQILARYQITPDSDNIAQCLADAMTEGFDPPDKLEVILYLNLDSVDVAAALGVLGEYIKAAHNQFPEHGGMSVEVRNGISGIAATWELNRQQAQSPSNEVLSCFHNLLIEAHEVWGWFENGDESADSGP